MAYHLRGRKSISTELSGIVAKEFDKALDELRDHADARGWEAVHEARKRVKKIRAVLRLLRTDLGNHYGPRNRRLRKVAHELSPLRDLDATAEMVRSVRDRYPDLITPSIFASVNRGFVARKRRTARQRDSSRALSTAARELRKTAPSTVRRIRRAADTAAVTAGFRRGYQRALNAMARVHAEPEDVRFHTWRRRVKDHWYHVRLVEELSARAHDRAQRLKRLETWLGDDHNLVLIREALLKAPARFGDHRTTTLVLGCVARYQTMLRRRALKLGGRLFKFRPGEFRRSMKHWLRSR
jgi:CHAD domain-containing protein